MKKIIISIALLITAFSANAQEVFKYDHVEFFKDKISVEKKSVETVIVVFEDYLSVNGENDVVRININSPITRIIEEVELHCFTGEGGVELCFALELKRMFLVREESKEMVVFSKN